MAAGSGEPCLVLRPTPEEFRVPFLDFVRRVMADHPDIPMFKVIPPAGWAPRRRPGFPDLANIEISCPIRQHAFGKAGAYRCLLVEQKGMSAADFERVAIGEASHVPPKVGRRDDDMCERAFWSSVTLRPPLYGADTPQSFFDKDLPFGWNLRDLGCLLKQYPVPYIPGVTFPMTYFGMWKSYFAWHLEDMDLMSVNYLHWGSPKVWYCVSPGNKEKFQQMAQSLFPDMHRECKAFLRHKDILLSPSFLKSYNIKYHQAKQAPGEFIVLNAGAYHSGFNLGFNCAEAVNFATEDWLPLGENATRCTCSALKDAVRISMDMFKKPPRKITTRNQAVQMAADAECPVAGLHNCDEVVVPERRNAKKRSAPVESSSMPERRRGKKLVAAVASKVVKGKFMDSTGSGKRANIKAAGRRQCAVKRKGQQANAGGRKRVRGVAREASDGRQADCDNASTDAGTSARSSGGCPGSARRDRTTGPSRSGRKDDHMRPVAVVGEDENTNEKYFYLVQRLGRESGGKKMVAVQWLQEGKDGLFRPQTHSRWDERADALVAVRTQWVTGRPRCPGGYKLLTLRKRILDTEIV
ncbi:unnamed protein product [Ostreobium quekettii]|uniref:Uncharacterized protein n=1 Tax=Ostreobium quekettii TaxID=121088 RepID=A0A8S1IW32_9CHLO|nr:unnamed protein product [Ostreobium quekettii]|eukprot:evm.model.scf_1035.1 EVM.evm.TU.scf_1035.1   scf_1035:20030-26051(-)